jgi:hypothetical protein
VQNLAHSASFESLDKDAPSKAGTKHLGRDAWSNRSVWVFLARRRLPAKTPDYAYWFSLDSLGFSRVNRDLSMGYADFRGKKFSWRFSPCVERRRDGSERSRLRESAGLSMRRA